MTAPIPDNERERLDALYQYAILDTPPEASFDQLTQLAARVCAVPIALISLIDSDRQWFKSQVGLTSRETSRESAFCAHTILDPNPLVVEDAATDPRFAQNELVLGDPGIRFYAAVPLLTAKGLALGSLCVIDRRPRVLTGKQLSTLQLLAMQVVEHLELRRAAEAFRRQSVLFERVQQIAHIGGWALDLRSKVLTWTEETYRIHGVNRDEYSPTVESALGFYTADGASVIRHAMERAISAGTRYDIELQIARPDGERRWVRVVGQREDDLQQSPQRLCGVFQDISARRTLESEIVLIAQREQTRIGFDLHDGLGQELSGISLILSALLRTEQRAIDPLRDDLRQLDTLVIRCHQDL